MDARSLARDLQAPLGMLLGIDHKMAETVGQAPRNLLRDR
jgi:hypothetical protein